MTEQLDPPSEQDRWLAYLASFEERVAQGQLTTAQVEVSRAFWQRARAEVPMLLLPVAGRSEDNVLYFSWTLKAPDRTIDVEFLPSGRIEWFFIEHEPREVAGTDDGDEPCVPDVFFSYLPRFARKP